MNRYMKTLALVAALGAASACGDDNNGDMDMSVATTPTKPTLGAQIDRMGRPGVNTALTNPFDTVMGSTVDGVKEAYNEESNDAMWGTKFAGYIAGNLAILDGLDTVCGNQFGAAAAGGDGGGNPYTLMGGALADDQVYVDTGKSTCGQYLAVEINAVAMAGLNDCGGRTPTMDTIDTTYSALAAGVLTGVGDGITQPTPAPNSTTFPFLGAPL
jgi:hypothetical protein